MTASTVALALFVASILGHCWVTANSTGVASSTERSSPSTAGLSARPSPGPTSVTTPGFYDVACSADSFSPSLSSFSSVWALINALLVVLATFFYLVYLCFFKFVDEVVHA
ncbi:ORF53 [Human gammaherpesvirus 8]|nr:ORF53 [Human gammaherpesvirus 8]